MTFPLIVSFYTKNTLYQLEVQNLIASCKNYDLEMCIEGIESFGSWELNCAYKPFFIYQKWQEFKRPLLWVDADAIFVRKPEWISAFNADVAARIDPLLSLNHPSKVMSGTVYINYTKPAERILQEWIVACKEGLLGKEAGSEFWDQTALRDALFLKEHGAVVESLPLAYTKIFDHKTDLLEAPCPVIEHYQASRRLKNLINSSDLNN